MRSDHFRYNGMRTRGTIGGEGVRHERRQDVFELIRAVLNHSEAQLEYCRSGGCQFVPVGDGLYQRVEAG